MSHFSVMVIGDNVDEQLAPFHEFECTGEDDQYVQEIDETEEYLNSYQTGLVTVYRKTEKVAAVAGGEGSVIPAQSRTVTIDEYNDALYRLPNASEQAVIDEVFQGNDLMRFKHGLTDKIGAAMPGIRSSFTSDDGYTFRVYDPEGLGYEKDEIPRHEFQSFLAFVQDKGIGAVVTERYKAGGNDESEKYRYILVDPEMNVLSIVRRTNPNAKWDWWREGGRWSRRLLLKDRKNGAGEPIEVRVDSAKAQDIDFDTSRGKAREEAMTEFDHYIATYSGYEEGYRAWEVVRAEHLDIDEAREAYASQPLVAAFKKEHPHSGFFGPSLSDFFAGTGLSIEERRTRFVKKAEFNSVATYAMVKDSQWAARGDMGWFGMSSNEVDEAEWQSKFLEQLDLAIAENALITIVDCHI